MKLLCTVLCIHTTELYESAEVDSRKAAVSKFNEVSFNWWSDFIAACVGY